MRTLKTQSSKFVTVFGLASQKIVKKIALPDSIAADLTLMDFLRDNGITIASSCGGVGTCRKCLVNTSLVSCQTNLNKFIQNNSELRVEISYL